MIWYRTVLQRQGRVRRPAPTRRGQPGGPQGASHCRCSRFLDIHYDPATQSHSYAFIDLALPYPGDKRLFGWDDYPHEGVTEIEQLESHPHHFHRRAEDGNWVFGASPMRGDIAHEMEPVIAVVRDHLRA